MPFPRPTLSQLRNRIRTRIASLLPSANAQLRYSNMGIIGEVQAGAEHELYGYLDWIAKESVPFTCTDEFLEAWSAFKNVIRKPATAGGGNAAFPATDGSVLPAGTKMARADGVFYTVTGDATASGGSVTAAILADAAEAAGNAATGTPLVLQTAVSGVTSTGAASGPLTGGADVETDAELRLRMLKAFAAPAQGGDSADYETWALQVPGVTRAWTKPLGMGVGTVVVYFMMDEAESAFNGFPQGTDGVAALETRDVPATGDQLAVADHIYPVRPVTALVYVVAPVANTVAFTIAGLSGASTLVRNAIKAAMAAAMLVDASPGGTVDGHGVAGGATQLSTIEAAIAGVAGAAGFVITSVTCPHGTVTPGPTGNILAAGGYLNTLGVVTFS